MTEDEAKTKWCPHYRVATSGGDPSSTYEMDNRPYDYDDKPLPVAVHRYACCIGSACMAWRWLPRVGDETLIEAIRRHREEFQSALVVAKNYVETHPEYMRKAPEPGAGFCGLAGAPQ